MVAAAAWGSAGAAQTKQLGATCITHDGGERLELEAPGPNLPLLPSLSTRVRVLLLALSERDALGAAMVCPTCCCRYSKHN